MFLFWLLCIKWVDVAHLWGNQNRLSSFPGRHFPKNTVVSELNEKLLKLQPGTIKTYLSIVKTVLDVEATRHPTVFLNSINPPVSMLQVKVGTPIMLLRNMQPPKMVNGTRLVVTKLMNNLLESKIITGNGAGELLTIPKITLKASDDCPIEFTRFQFPVKVFYAMTINNSQGQKF